MKRLVLPSTLWLCLVAMFFIGQNAYAQTLPDFTELVEDAAPGRFGGRVKQSGIAEDNRVIGWKGNAPHSAPLLERGVSMQMRSAERWLSVPDG